MRMNDDEYLKELAAETRILNRDSSEQKMRKSRNNPSQTTTQDVLPTQPLQDDENSSPTSRLKVASNILIKDNQNSDHNMEEDGREGIESMPGSSSESYVEQEAGLEYYNILNNNNSNEIQTDSQMK